MDDMNACAECGYTTNNFMEFLKHIDEHEKEKIIVVDDDDIKDSHGDDGQNGDIDHSPSTSPSGSNSNSSGENIRTKMVSSFSVSSMLADSSGPESPLNLSAVSNTSVTNSPATGRAEKHMHSCPHCNFTTYMSQHMKSHLEAHERHQGQMFQCDICQMQFSQKANMHRHRMRHSGVKPYQCRFCLKKFFRKDQMQEHSMTHIKTGDDFDCPVAICPHKFSQHSALRTHLEEQHTITPSSQASCKRCSLMFSNSRRLLLHYQTKHDDAEVAILSRAAINQGLTQNLDIDTALQLITNSAQAKIPRPPIKRRRMNAPTTVSITSTPTSVITSTSSVITSAAAAAAAAAAANAMDEKPIDLVNKIAASLRSKTTTPEKEEKFVIMKNDEMRKAESPKLLPKAESPVYANMLTNGFKQLSHQDLLMSIANSATANPLFNPKNEPTHMHMQLWTNEANSTTTTTIDDHSSTHSPSADSRSSTSNISQENDDLLKERLECTHCGVIFLDQTMYLLHKGLHSESDPWKCNLCGHGCGDKYMFTTHVISSDHN